MTNKTLPLPCEEYTYPEMRCNTINGDCVDPIVGNDGMMESEFNASEHSSFQWASYYIDLYSEVNIWDTRCILINKEYGTKAYNSKGRIVYIQKPVYYCQCN